MVIRSFAICACFALVGCVDIDLSEQRFACTTGGPCDAGSADAIATKDASDANDASLDAGAHADTGGGSDADTGPRDSGSACNAGPSGTWTRVTASGAIPRAGHTAVVDGNRALIFGGATSNEIAALTIAPSPAFAVITTSTHPPARSEHGAMFDPDEDEMLIAGGRTPAGALLGDTWIFDIESESWSLEAALDSPRASPAAALDDEALLFHGCGAVGPLDEVWYLSFVVYEWFALATDPPRPAARCDHAAVAVPNLGTLIFGGRGVGALDDLWLLEAGILEWSALPMAGPPARAGHSMVRDRGRDRVLLFGGEASDGALFGDLWALSIDEEEGVQCWAELTPAGELPSARAQHAAFMLEGRMYLYGGDDGVVRDDLWELTF